MILLLALASPSFAAEILVYGPLDYTEAAILTADGHTVTEWDASVWASAVQSDFEAFDAIVIGDKSCSGPSSTDFETLYTTRATWSAAVTGNIVVTQTDAGCHSSSTGAEPFIEAAVDWASSGSATGLYASGDWGRRDYDYLDEWGSWGTTTSHYDSVTITDTTHPIFTGVSTVSGWGNTAHATIDTYPSDWDVVATNAAGTATIVVLGDCDADGDGELDADRCGGTDCDDSDATINSLATEIAADGIDQDCDDVDDCYYDNDMDGYGGGPATPGTTLDCSGGSAETTDDSDCDDTNAAIYPGAAETVGDGIDQDCDEVDDCYTDGDGDGFGISTVETGADLSCTGASTTNDDCDDSDGAINPGAVEITADGIDQDCDEVDDCYVDGDLDEYGSTETLTGADLTCENPGESDDATDCDDDDDLTHPGAAPLDDATACMTDADEDDYGDAAATGDVTAGTDCDDAEAATYPGATDTWYDGVDSDCAGDDDNDADADGYGVDDDCDDGDAAVYPGAADTWYDGVDSDCAGNNDDDADVDGYGIDEDCDDADADINPGATDTWYDGVDSDCAGNDDNDADADGVGVDEDCDDTDATIYPGAEDIADDGIDQDCDGEDAVTPDDGGGDGGGDDGDDVGGDDDDKDSADCSSMPATDMALTPLLLGLVALAGRRRRRQS
jgi:MYXO-CTERM domain-containing protein